MIWIFVLHHVLDSLVHALYLFELGVDCGTQPAKATHEPLRHPISGLPSHGTRSLTTFHNHVDLNLHLLLVPANRQENPQIIQLIRFLDQFVANNHAVLRQWEDRPDQD